MQNTPTANRPHIALFGRCNVGKSSLMNALTGQDLAVVSEVSGTTTDPVSKTMELLPLGPVVVIDTPGLDDDGELGSLRMHKAKEIMRKTDIALIVVDAEHNLGSLERELLNSLKEKGCRTIIVVNKCDLLPPSDEKFDVWRRMFGLPLIAVSAKTHKGIEELKNLLGDHPQFEDPRLALVSDLIAPGDFVVLVIPVDKAAPKGRLILPQQQAIRDIIEFDAIAVMTKEHELKETLRSLLKKPSLVITDSQAFLKVTADTPSDIRLTSFSILLARKNGDLIDMVRGLLAINHLQAGDQVLIVEGCTHHRQADDIGKVKIPRWVRQLCGGEVRFDLVSGGTFPSDLTKYKAVIHCGGCMINRKEMDYRLSLAKAQNVAITNYGMLIAHVQGVLKRALEPFPAAAMVLEEQNT